MASIWLEYLTAISAAVAAIGTLGAVLAALYLNLWRETRRRPELHIDVGQRLNMNTPSYAFLLNVTNAAGRSTAYDVEVLLSVQKSDDQLAALHRPLTWAFGSQPVGIGDRHVDIPPGVTRPLTFAYLGDIASIIAAVAPQHAISNDAPGPHSGLIGVFSFFPLQRDSLTYVKPETYQLTFMVSARDTDAQRYTADVTFERDASARSNVFFPTITPFTKVS